MRSKWKILGAALSMSGLLIGFGVYQFDNPSSAVRCEIIEFDQLDERCFNAGLLAEDERVNADSASELVRRFEETRVDPEPTAEKVANAAESLLFAAQSGDPKAQYVLGVLLLNGEGGFPQLEERGRAWISLAAQSDSIPALHALASESAREGNFEAAQLFYERLHNLGNVGGTLLWAQMLLGSSEREADFEKAIGLLRPLVDAGVFAAKAMLIDLYGETSSEYYNEAETRSIIKTFTSEDKRLLSEPGFAHLNEVVSRYGS